MTINKSQSRDGVAISGVRTGNKSPVQVVNNVHSRTEEEKRQQGAVGIMAIISIIVVALSVHFAPKWMDFLTAAEAFVPTATTDYIKSTKKVEHLQEELQRKKKETALTADMLNVFPPDDQKRSDDLQYQINIAREDQQGALDNIVELLIRKLKTGEIIATGYDQAKQQWVCPIPSDWEDLKLSGTLTQTSITGGRSGHVHLITARFGQPLVTADAGIAAEDSSKADHGPSRLCQGPGAFNNQLIGQTTSRQ